MKKFSLLLLILFFSTQSFAIKIIQSKGNKVLLDLEDEALNVGQKLSLFNSSNKKIAIVTVTQSKKGRALAVLNKGKLDGATSVEIIDAPISAEAPAVEGGSPSADTKSVFRIQGMKVSGLLTISSNTMGTKQSDISLNQENVALKGTSIGLTGALDYPINSWLTLRGTLGYEPFSASGTSSFVSCASVAGVPTSKNCTADISYLSAGGYARFDLTKSRFLTWVAAGGTTKFPISKSTTALKSDDIKMTLTFAGAVGIDFFISNKSYIPASLEIQMFQSSDTVTASIMMIRTGYGWAF